MSKTHTLKTLPEYFIEVWNGKKKFEVRKNDRDFQVGDILKLIEYDPQTENSTGFIHQKVSYILHGPAFGIQEGYCVMSLTELDEND